MTVIAAFAVEGFPILFGDLLLTGPGTNDRKVAVPAQGEVQDFFGNSGWVVSGLTQKVNLLSSDCVIAWAGSWLGARVAIAHLRQLSSTRSLTCDEILDYLNDEPDLKTHSVSFVGLTREDGALRQFRFNAEEFLSPSLGTVYLSGSGSVALHEFSELLVKMETRSAGSANVAETGVARALSLGGLLLQSEFRGGAAASTLRNMFGGGYEIAFYSDGRFQKLGDITYVVWEAALVADGVQVSCPQLLVKQRYAGDMLLLRSARVDSTTGEKLPRVVDEQRHVIRPMFDASVDIPPHELSEISLQSRLLCHCILVREAGQVLGIYTRVQRYSPDSEITVSFEDKGGELVFGFRQDTISEFAQSLERFRNAAPSLRTSPDG